MVASLLPSSSRGRRRKDQVAKPHQRLDIQGLRMVAVMLVVLSHLFDWPRGGFIGVDVFFVISGFLITGSLMHTVEKTGRISFSSFYRRRVRRILPAATLVLAVTVVAAYFIYTTSRFKSIVLDSVAAFFFVSNWRFGIEGTDYFTATGPVSPLQHYWSLSVEEQFYFVWPAVIFAIAVVAARMAWTGRARIALAGGVMGVVVIASFIYSFLDTASNPTWAYFSTLTRVWELGVGALLAITITYFEGIPDRLRPFIAWTGLILIAVGAFVITETGGGFPAPWAAVPVLGAALIICAGVRGEQKYLQVLTNRVSTYVGDISYSLYLWHWPVIILLAALMDGGTYYYIAALFMMFGFSIAAYHFFENPIRASKWLETGAERKERAFLDVSRWRLPALKISETNQSIGIGALALATAGLIAFALAPGDTITPAPAYTATASGASEAEPVDALQAEIGKALRATEFPELSPSLDNVAEGKAVELAPDAGCLNPSSFSNSSQCTYGPVSATKTAVVVGDSIGISWMPGVRGALEPEGWKVHGVGISNCPFVDASIALQNDPSSAQRCNDGRPQIVEQIRQLRPDLVIISDSERGIERLSTDAGSSGAWTSARTSIIRQIAESGTRVVILSPNPSGKAVADCVTRNSSPRECVSAIPSVWEKRRGADAAAATATNATFVDTQSWFCLQGQCPIFVANNSVRWDTGHATKQYIESLAPRIAQALLN
ncbi:acyltransferase family protein [Rhodococcus globerulus]|uniref:Acyltransferase family protein n=1 Tax=Rhodococcus globerulus TaxID=33008 RepID=A0ABU4BS91_RHOGO|nr:acyltransferase family protein [Rhodococcus globerulus]MDV6267092.1 acyltransferase family protein [Rhodococcus globerulus]